MAEAARAEATWQDEVYDALRRAGVRQVGYVPDAGHARLIVRAHEDPEMEAVVLTTEEEGVALAAGAHLGGQRAVLLMQSSGVGNTINMLSLPITCRMPFLTLVTMHVRRADHAGEVAGIVAASAALAFDCSVPVAVLFSQRLIGAKVFVE
jgi:sulfopyruvate decarboxylase TPP-binding subunit